MSHFARAAACYVSQPSLSAAIRSSTLRGGPTGTLRLGVVPTALPAASLLTTPFCDRHPRAGVRLESLSSAEITHGLAEFELDAAMTCLDDDALHQVRRVPPPP